MNAIELSSSISRFVDQIKPTNNPSDDALIRGLPKWFIEDLENSATMLRQQAKEIEVLNQSYEILFKHRIEQEKLIYELHKKNEELIIENEVLRVNLRDVANQLRNGVSKIQQKTMARVIENCFGEKK